MARRATRQIEKSAPRAVAPLARVKPAQKAAAKVSTRLAKASTAPTTVGLPSLDGLSADQKVTVLLRERDKLVQRLQAAEMRVADLQERDAQLADRIAWALDTLNDLLRLSDTSS